MALLPPQWLTKHRRAQPANDPTSQQAGTPFLTLLAVLSAGFPAPSCLSRRDYVQFPCRKGDFFKLSLFERK